MIYRHNIAALALITVLYLFSAAACMISFPCGILHARSHETLSDSDTSVNHDKTVSSVNPFKNISRKISDTQKSVKQIYKAFRSIFKSIILVIAMIVCIFWCLICIVGLIIVFAIDLITLFQSGLLSSYWGFFTKSTGAIFDFLSSLMK